jgi:hypothetical protein
MQQDVQARNKPDIPHSQKMSTEDLHAVLTVIVHTGHNYKPSMTLYKAKDKPYHIHFYSNVVPHRFFKILKYLHFADNKNPQIQDRQNPNYDRLWKIRQVFDVLIKSYQNRIIQQNMWQWMIKY